MFLASVACPGDLCLAGAREDLVSVLSMVKGRAGAEAAVTELEEMVRGRAEEGATRALRNATLILAAAGAFAVVAGVWAVREARRR